MSKTREYALKMLRHRVARLARLLELEAPDIILVNEAQLVADAGEALNPEYWHSKKAEASAAKFKRSLQLCCHDDCEESVAWIPSAETPTCPGPFHGQSCLKHALEDEAEQDEEDKEHDMDEELDA